MPEKERARARERPRGRGREGEAERERQSESESAGVIITSASRRLFASCYWWLPTSIILIGQLSAKTVFRHSMCLRLADLWLKRSFVSLFCSQLFSPATLQECLMLGRPALSPSTGLWCQSAVFHGSDSVFRADDIIGIGSLASAVGHF